MSHTVTEAEAMRVIQDAILSTRFLSRDGEATLGSAIAQVEKGEAPQQSTNGNPICSAVPVAVIGSKRDRSTHSTT